MSVMSCEKGEIIMIVVNLLFYYMDLQTVYIGTYAGNLKYKSSYTRSNSILLKNSIIIYRVLFTSPNICNHTHVSLLTFPPATAGVKRMIMTRFEVLLPPSLSLLRHQVHIWWMARLLGWCLRPLLVPSLISPLSPPVVIAGVSWTKMMTCALW